MLRRKVSRSCLSIISGEVGQLFVEPLDRRAARLRGRDALYATNPELKDHDISELGYELPDAADLPIPEYFQSVVRESETHRSSIGL